MSFLDDLNKYIGQVGDIAKQSVEIYGEIIGASEDEKAKKTVPYQPNISASDLAFQPNWYLVGFGLILLAIVFFARK